MSTKARRLPVLQGVVPVDRKRIPVDMLAGVTLAALGIPEVMGYTKIAGMPVITGLYTILIPIAVFALLGSSRHLVVGADSATAAILAAGLAGAAPIASPQYVALAGALAIVTGGVLILARLLRLGFIADFLSRSVLIGFLTGVGIQVAMGQVAGMLGVSAGTGGTIHKFVTTLGNIGDTSVATLAVSLSVLTVIVGARLINRKIPGALIAVVGAILVSWNWDLVSHGVAILGQVPSGLPSFGIPDVTWGDIPQYFGIVGAMFLVILAQSAATSRAYAAKYEELFDEDLDLVALGLANMSAGLSGAFVVNGSPTKTQMVDSAGGRSQLATLTTAFVVLVVLLFLTVPLQYLPNAVLSSVVFMIGIELVDIAGMRAVARVRFDEFTVAVITAVTVVVVGVEQAVVLAVIISIIDHLRRGYRPNDSVIASGAKGTELVPPTAGSRTMPGLVIYRFGAGLYFANASRFAEEVLEILSTGDPVQWFCVDAEAVDDVDYSGSKTLLETHAHLSRHGIRLLFARMPDDVRKSLDRYGITALVGADGYYRHITDVIHAFEQRAPGPEH
jgi:high affinity sulfate transporter 1